jgi:hypothetical protein
MFCLVSVFLFIAILLLKILGSITAPAGMVYGQKRLILKAR